MDLAIRDLDALSQGAKVIPAVAAAGKPYPLAGRRSELLHHGRRDGLLPGAFEGGGGSLRIGLRLIAGRFQAGYAILECRVVQVGHTALDGGYRKNAG